MEKCVGREEFDVLDVAINKGQFEQEILYCSGMGDYPQRM